MGGGAHAEFQRINNYEIFIVKPDLIHGFYKANMK